MNKVACALLVIVLGIVVLHYGLKAYLGDTDNVQKQIVFENHNFGTHDIICNVPGITPLHYRGVRAVVGSPGDHYIVYLEAGTIQFVPQQFCVVTRNEQPN